MTEEDALDLVRKSVLAKTGQHLTALQREIVLGVWQRQSYKEIADNTGYTEQYVSDVASQLWKLLSEAWGTKVTQKRFQEAAECQYLRQQYITVSNAQGSVEDRVQQSAVDPNFLGREEAIAYLKNLIEQGAKAIVIHGKGGIGKSWLASHFLNTQGFDKILELWMAKETQTITTAESVIEEWLRRYFDEEPGREFGVTLDRLRQHLRNPNPRIGVLIDNLEPVLDGNGRCIEAHRKYVELFTALADPAVQSVTLITSRECLREASVTVEHYRLEGLDVAAWEKFFNSRNIQIDTEVLNAMHQAYGGNAKAMQIIPGAIKEYNNSLAAYWQSNKDDLLIERELEGLVVSQFDRLQQLDLSAYKLLCRLGCYRYQDVPRVPIGGLFCLLWEVQDSQHRRVIKSLRDRSLVEFENGEYWLHSVIRAEAIKRLRESEDWETANCKAAEYWTGSVNIVETTEDAMKVFETSYHYKEINDSSLANHIIIKAFNFAETAYRKILMSNSNFVAWKRGYSWLFAVALADENLEQAENIISLYNYLIPDKMCEKIGAKCDLAEAYYQLALTYQKMGDTEKSQTNFQKAIRLFTKMEAPKQVEKVKRAMENGKIINR